jgi:hypothetical protein
MAPRSKVSLPRGVRTPFTVFVSGVPQQEGRDYVVADGVLLFAADLAKEGKLGFWRWFWGGLMGIGTYRKNDQVDVAWHTPEGHPRIAHALDIERVEETPAAP